LLKGALRLAAGTASLATGGWVLRALNDAPASLGAGPGEIGPVADRSPHYRDGVFHNLEPSSALRLDVEENRLVLFDMFSSRSTSLPQAAVPLADSPPPATSEPLAVSWLGHSTALLEIDGYRVLTDPIWSERCSPSRTVGPQRLHPVPAPLESLPALDAVVVSHDHYDHLDMDTVLALARTQRAPFVVPLGVGAHLRQWRIPPERIVELDWNEEHRIGELTLVSTPARHFSGRFLSRNTTLWSSWAIVGPRHRAYFGGDTGYTSSFAQIGADHGPFDLTLMPIGAYNKAWPDIHMNPEEAVQAHRDITDAGLLVPIHWCTFRLAPHPWAEPVERLLTAADGAGVDVAVPQPGGRVVSGFAPADEGPAAEAAIERPAAEAAIERPAAQAAIERWWRL
jgi:L-ascorbate metabolism protein UlaG (beta-lactamase superfamily)